MKRFFLVEADTDYESLFCYELEQKSFSKFERNGGVLFNEVSRPHFFGKLNSICISKEKLAAPPLELAPPESEPEMERDRR